MNHFQKGFRTTGAEIIVDCRLLQEVHALRPILLYEREYDYPYYRDIWTRDVTLYLAGRASRFQEAQLLCYSNVMSS